MAIFAGPEVDGWRYGRVDDGSVHIEPVDDVIDHEVEDCACGPTVEPVPADDGSVGWLVTHHSLDGRELRERAGRSAA